MLINGRLPGAFFSFEKRSESEPYGNLYALFRWQIRNVVDDFLSSKDYCLILLWDTL